MPSLHSRKVILAAIPSPNGRSSFAGGPARAPQAAATEGLYERHATKILSYCLHQLGSREEAEDAVQTTFMNAFRALGRGVVPEAESAWLFKIAENVCLSRRRSSWRRGRIESPSDFDVIEEIVPGPSRHRDELIGIEDALASMPEQQRRAILLREWQGLSYREIADELEVSQSAVETLIFRARRSLAQGLEQPELVKKPKRKGFRRALHMVDLGTIAAAAKTLLAGGVAAKATVAAVAVTAAATTAVVTPKIEGHSPKPAAATPAAVAPASAPVSSPEAAVAPAPVSVAVVHDGARVAAGGVPRAQAAQSVPGKAVGVRPSVAPRAAVPGAPGAASPVVPAQVPVAAPAAEPAAAPTPVAAPEAPAPVAEQPPLLTPSAPVVQPTPALAPVLAAPKPVQEPVASGHKGKGGKGPKRRGDEPAPILGGSTPTPVVAPAPAPTPVVAPTPEPVIETASPVVTKEPATVEPTQPVAAPATSTLLGFAGTK